MLHQLRDACCSTFMQFRSKWSGERRAAFSESQPERNAAAEPQTEARRLCDTSRMLARDEHAVCGVERASAKGNRATDSP